MTKLSTSLVLNCGSSLVSTLVDIGHTYVCERDVIAPKWKGNLISDYTACGTYIRILCNEIAMYFCRYYVQITCKCTRRGRMIAIRTYLFDTQIRTFFGIWELPRLPAHNLIILP